MSKYTPYLLLISLVLLAFWPVFNSFFQQDEWLAFGYHYLVDGEGLASFLKNAFIPRLGHYSPFNYISEFLLFLLLRLNFVSWAVLSVILHILNSILVYKIGLGIFKKKVYALSAASIFAVATSAFQATSWPVADIGTHGATLFALLSIKYWLKNSQRYLVISTGALAISLAFKETAIALFVLLPLLAKVMDFSKKHQIDALKYMSILFSFFVVIRLLALVVPAGALVGTIYDQQVSNASQNSLDKFAYNLFTYPIKGITQSVIPPHLLVSLSQSIANIIPVSVSGEPNTTQRDIFALKYVVEFLNVVIFVGFLVLARKSGRLGIYLLVFVMLNSVVFALSPERTGRITVIDSRNLYLLSAGSALLILQILHKKTQKFVIGVVLIVVSINLLSTYRQVQQLSEESNVRKRILTQIKNENPDLPDKVIFYTSSDKAYYGLPKEEKIMPFQSGMGQTLLIWYYQKEKFPSEFLKRKFLWEIKDQGYNEIDGIGFGYFRDYDLLIEELINKKIPVSSVIAYKWYAKIGKLERIDQEFYKKLSKEIN